MCLGISSDVWIKIIPAILVIIFASSSYFAFRFFVKNKNVVKIKGDNNTAITGNNNSVNDKKE